MDNLSTSNRSIAKLPFPPGPPAKPIIGNLLDVPSSDFWLKATEWGKIYGQLSSKLQSHDLATDSHHRKATSCISMCWASIL